MNDQIWLSETDPLVLLDHLFPVRGLDSTEPQSRQSRLYLLACARQFAPNMPSLCKAIADLAERIYGGRFTDRRLVDEVYPLAEQLIHCRGEHDECNRIGQMMVDRDLLPAKLALANEDIDPKVWFGYAHLVYFPFSRSMPHYHSIPPELHSADLIREIFGFPFRRRPALKPDVRTDNVFQLARCADSTLDFSVLPVLADALEDAGCTDEDLLKHLRSAVAHTRGCWALEEILAIH